MGFNKRSVTDYGSKLSVLFVNFYILSKIVEVDSKFNCHQFPSTTCHYVELMTENDLDILSLLLHVNYDKPSNNEVSIFNYFI